jgi:hypothetical protein
VGGDFNAIRSEFVHGERAFPVYTLQHGPFTPELQWQPRGQRRILQGVSTANACGRQRPSLLRVQGGYRGGVPAPSRPGDFGAGRGAAAGSGAGNPFNTGCLPLSYSGNPGVTGVSHKGVNWVQLEEDGSLRLICAGLDGEELRESSQAGLAGGAGCTRAGLPIVIDYLFVGSVGMMTPEGAMCRQGGVDTFFLQR